MGDSFCKLIYDVKKCQLVGVHIIGSYASEMMYGAAAMAYSKLPMQHLDKIVFIEDGRVEAVGPHDELYRSCAEYRRMVDLQKLEDEEGGGSHG